MNDVIVEFEKEIEEMKIIVYGCDKEFKDFVVEVCSLRNIIVCGFIMFIFYYCVIVFYV